MFIQNNENKQIYGDRKCFGGCLRLGERVGAETSWVQFIWGIMKHLKLEIIVRAAQF